MLVFLVYRDRTLEKKKVDDYIFGGLVVATVIGGLLTFLGASRGEVVPLFIWSINCGLTSLAGTIFEG